MISRHRFGEFHSLGPFNFFVRIMVTVMSLVMITTLAQAIVSPPGAADSPPNREGPLLAAIGSEESERNLDLRLDPSMDPPAADFAPLAPAGTTALSGAASLEQNPSYTFGFDGQSSVVAFKKGGAPCAETCDIRTGTMKPYFGASELWRSALRFDFTQLAGRAVAGARLDLRITGQDLQMKQLSQVTARLAGNPPGYDVLGAELGSSSVTDVGSIQSAAFTAFVADRVAAGDTGASFMLTGEEAAAYSYKIMQANLVVEFEGGSTGEPDMALVAPADDAIISTPTATLKVAAEGAVPDGTTYCFKVSTGFDGRTGSVAQSGCLPQSHWTVPRHVLQDGTRYTWTVETAHEGSTTTNPANWVGHFTVDRRMGNPGPTPTDSLGGVTVNLFNGNVRTDVSGPIFETLGGPAGLTFAYNSRTQGEPHGVRASYFNDSGHDGTPDETPVLVRTETQVDLNWGNRFNDETDRDPLPPGLTDDWYVVRWEGQFRAPANGDYRFAGAHVDGAKIWVGDRVVYDNPDRGDIFYDNFTTAGPKRADEVTLVAGQRVPIKVELHHQTADPPAMVLWVKSTQGSASLRMHNVVPRIVPADWLYAADPTPVPAGWTMSVPASGYSHAELRDGSVVLTDGVGGKHTWAQTDGGYAPPPGRDGVVAFAADGQLSVTENGVISLFNVDGTLAEVATVLDSKKPASLQYRYSGTPSRLVEITDPVSGRSHTLHYNTGNSNSCYGGAAFPTGADPAPAQMLCRITYWDGTETRLWYVLNVLARIENPGAAMRDFNYLNLADVKTEYNKTSNPIARQELLATIGPLTSLRGPLAYDWVVSQSVPGVWHRTVIDYQKYVEEPGMPEVLRAVAVSAPSSDGGTTGQRPVHYYGYDIGAKKAIVNFKGTGDVGSAPDRTVTWDEAARLLSETDAEGNTAYASWNQKDQLTARVDTTGRRKAIVYDHADRPTDEYGPAPVSCFNGQVPTSACAGTMAHTRRQYDENIFGLEAAFYDNRFMAGVPAIWATGVGSTDGSLSRNWGSTPPVESDDGWSGRFTGEIQLPLVGDYSLGFTMVDGVRLWVDDVLLVDSWSDKPTADTVSAAYSNATADSWHRIRVDYYKRSGSGGFLDFTWDHPGAGAAATVPGQYLRPRYGLETSEVVDNTSGGDVERAPALRKATGHSDPMNGIDPVFGTAVSETVDPGGLDLTNRRLFEQPGQGFLRHLAAALPAGDIADPTRRGTSTYYGDADTRANPCDSGSAPVSQGGRVKTVSAAKDSQGSANVRETVYDNVGRVVAARTNGEPWSCVTYDARGRINSKSFPKMGDKPARTITYDHAANGDPLTFEVTDESGSTTTVINLLGQIVAFTDASGITTVSTYDAAGRTTKEATAVNGVTSSLNYYWNAGSRLERLDLDGTTVATPGYTAGVLDSAGYGNNSKLAITHNEAGSPTAYKWDIVGSTITSAVTRSPDQRVTDETVTDSANPATTYDYLYTYDGVGRLIAATVPHHQLTYGFADQDGCGINNKAGRNTNRTSSTDSFNGAPSTTTNYCYDSADRLLSTSGDLDLLFTYDNYGNAIKVGTDTLGYDSTRRHVSTTTAAGSSIQYVRDVHDRITKRNVQGGTDPTKVTRYGFTSAIGGPTFILDDSGNLRQRVVTLPGGAVLTKNYTQETGVNWSYPNIHGDILFTADATATRTGDIHLYDPFGQNIDPVTGGFGDIPIPATADGGMDFGYLGQHTVPIEHLAGLQSLEMGARTYLPALGRFLQTDPILGGSANNYDYANADPINSFDLTGEKPSDKPDGPGTNSWLELGLELFNETMENHLKDFDESKASASGREQDRNGYSKAGRSLAKRVGKNNNAAGWPVPEGKKDAAAWNALGEKLLDTMLSNPDKEVILNRGNIDGRYDDCIDVRMPDGTGFRLDTDGNFSGFLDKYDGPG
ncbi:PA14 domain-containing protein [Nocardia salmonicida]|uniref:PA14 domain-containing protein n=1 Tax=Nocardia salmonicida TaxID=53431 RepID=UPI0010427DFD|nr:PA14 domain-containing protein [Nocardia salmonicida]